MDDDEGEKEWADYIYDAFLVLIFGAPLVLVALFVVPFVVYLPIGLYEMYVDDPGAFRALCIVVAVPVCLVLAIAAVLRACD